MIVMGGVLLSGCATRKFVRDGAMAQDKKIADIETQVEANQRGLQQGEERLDGMSDELAEAERIGRDAGNRADEAYQLAKGKLLYEVVLSEVAGDFAFDSAEFTEAAAQRLDELASRLRSENANVYLEIQGHTDSTGPESYNLKLGLRRAEAVRRYLNSKHGIPLHRMSVISYGESKPVADNSTREGRAKNRRVEIRVLS